MCLRSLTLLLLVSGLSTLVGPLAPARAQEGPAAPGVVDVVQVSGLIDPILVDFVGDAVATADAEGVEALILQLDSPGSVVGQDELEALSEGFAEADVPVVVWVGDARAEALGGAAQLAVAADITAMAPGTRLGDAPSDAGLPDRITTGTVDAEDAFDAGVSDLTQDEAAVLRNVIAAIHGREVKGRAIQTVQLTEVAGEPDQATPVVDTRLSRLPLGSQLLHTAASPSVAFLLLAAGLALLVFELFTAGVGIAGVVGAGSLVLASYGLAVLPTNPVGLVLCLVGMLGFAIDVQTGVPRVWTVVGTVSFALGAVLLFGDGLRASWLALLAGVVGVVLLMLAGLPATVRSRFSTPTIGRESMVGELGEATAAIAPEGVARVRGALWRARTNRATPIEAGGAVRVVAIEGTVLEVEPESGGARDYRERRAEA
jgi:membrane-bound serine protease (ClpP class)